jgi:gas vesicle protein
MVTQQRNTHDPTDPWSDDRGGRGRPGTGALLVAALLGVGVGLLAAPQPGTKTRKQLLKRLAELSEGMGEGLEDVQDVSTKAGKRVKERLAKLREEAGDEWEGVEERLAKAKRRLRDVEIREHDDSSSFGKLLALAAGLAATYFMTSERTATARSRVQHTAADVGRRATDQWDRFQRGGFKRGRESNESRSETRTGSNPSGEAPPAS